MTALLSNECREAFLAHHALAIRDRVLQLGDRSGAKHLESSGASAVDIIDWSEATTVLRSNSYDCVVWSPCAAPAASLPIVIQAIACALKPGGALLATFAVAGSKLPEGTERLRTTVDGVTRLLSRAFPEDGIEVGFSRHVPTRADALSLGCCDWTTGAPGGPADPISGLTVVAVKPFSADTDCSELVSVVIPCFNQGPFLDDAISSVLRQTHQNVETIVVDDGSTDDTARRASMYSGVRLIRQRNQGLAAARNAGIRESRGQYVTLLDADDRLLPDAIRTNLSWLRRRPDWAFVSGEHRYIDQSGKIVGEWRRDRVLRRHYERLLEGNYVGMGATVMYTREVFERCGVFARDWSRCEDYELYLRVARRFSIGNHSTLVAEYRRYGTAASDNIGLMLRSALAVLRAQRPHVAGDSRLERARDTGAAYWKTYYGPQLAARLATGAGPTSARALDFWTLLRHAPRALAAWRRIPTP